MNFIDLKIEEYANAHTSPESELLNKIQRETNLESTSSQNAMWSFSG